MGEYDIVPEADPKVTKQEFAYVEDKVNPKCEACNMFIKEGENNIGKCTIVKGSITLSELHATVTLYAKGRVPSRTKIQTFEGSDAILYTTRPSCPFQIRTGVKSFRNFCDYQTTLMDYAS